jgi:hypothetical protein
MILASQGFAADGQDLDGESGWFPGPGGGNKHHRNLEVYLDPGLDPAMPQKPLEGTAGLLIAATDGKLVTKQIDQGNGKMKQLTPDAKIWIESGEDGSALLNQYADRLIAQGHYTLTLRMRDLERHFLNFVLKGDLETQSAVTLIRVNASMDVSMDHFAAWMLDGAGGTCIVLHHDGKLPVSELLEAVFVANTGINQVGVLQLEFNDEGVAQKQTAMMIERCQDEVKMEVKESTP